MVRGRIAADTDFFADPPDRENRAGSSAGYDDWGDTEWGGPHLDIAADIDEVHDDSGFGDEFARDYSDPLAADDVAMQGEWPDPNDSAAGNAGQPGSAATRRRALLLAAVAVVVGAGACLVVFRPDGAAPTAGPPTTTQSSTVLSSVPSTSMAMSAVTGSGAGDVTSGPGVILGYFYAYYKSRSGELAAQFLTPALDTPNVVAAMQHEIDQLEAQTTHQATIAPTSNPSIFDVMLQLTPADGVPRTFYQRYTVTQTNGRYYLADKQNCGTQPCPPA